MSGAGRGTPRVSPTDNVPPIVPGAGTTPSGSIIALPSAPFRYNGPGGPPLVLTAAAQEYLFDDPDIPGIIRFPVGTQRGWLVAKYTEGAAGGEVGLRFLTGGEQPIMYPSSQSNSGDVTATVELRELEFLLKDTSSIGNNGFVIIPFRLSQTTYQMTLSLRETGVPGTPGTFEVSFVIADNIPENGIFNNISV